MSRFGLRSKSEIFKIPDEELHKKSGKTSKPPIKRFLQKKKQLIENTANSYGLSSEKEKNDSIASLVCSLPLSRLSDILEKIQAGKSNLELTIQNNKEALTKCEEKTTNVRTLPVELSCISTAEVYDNSNSIHFNELKFSQKQPVRILCLYCDKKFTSYKMQSNHVEKFHIQHKNRRCSGRNSQMVSTVGFKKRDETLGMIMFGKYPGCAYCKRSKSHRIIASAKDLNGLFLHFIDFHADKYFGCKECMQRFQNMSKLSKHMQTVHKSIKLSVESIDKSMIPELKQIEQLEANNIVEEKMKGTKTRSLKLQKSARIVNSSIEDIDLLNSNTVIGGEEPILSRLGLAQNRFPNNRKCLRVRKESMLSDVILKSDQQSMYMSAVKARNKSGKNVIRESGDADIVFRMPSRTEILSCVFDDNFYREVVSNVRHNLLYHLDGKLKDNSAINTTKTAAIIKNHLPMLCSTLVENPMLLSASVAVDSEIHAATSLTATTAFPTLLTAEQYGGDIISSKIRRPHTKNSWKWKWDSVKKFKIINEGGKLIKKVKQPMLGLRDLSKLDMWTQLIMRQKRETHQQRIGPELLNLETNIGNTREEKQRLNEQLNLILDMRLLPRIILEQNEQAVIKLEYNDFEFPPYQQNSEADNTDNILGQSFIDDGLLSILKLLPNFELRCSRRQLVLSGEWARPRCYLCMCCGAKFEKLKSLEEHKMFRHSHVLCTHYEVVGRELLAGNSIRHFFIPNRALSYYGNETYNFSTFTRKFNWDKDDTTDMGRRLITGSTGEDDSSDSIQSTLNSCTMNTYSIKNSTDECDTDTKITLDINTVSPSHSMQSSNSSFTLSMKMHLKSKEVGLTQTKCSKCSRKCNGILDLYRHMLDCSGDYIWSLAKKRKYRYYCGSKRRRPWNKHNFTELRKTKPKCLKTSQPANDTEESIFTSKIKTPPRQRPSDAESIKKMLENLPPKRVCKTIFPPLPKAKKSKSKFLAKHNIFNTKGRLRKTRARKMSMLSKSKSQYSNKMTRSKSKNLQRKTKKVANVRACEHTNLAEKDNLPQSTVNNVSLLLENSQKFQNPKGTITQINDSNSNVTLNTITNSKRESSDIVPPHCTVAKITQDLSELAKKDESRLSGKGQCDGQLFEGKIETANEELLNKKNGDLKASTSLTNINNNKKRSKKINDCIAMLTGKLEEKLKTGRDFSKREKSCSTKEKNDVDIRNINCVKPPKRKTVSRRIIKVDNIEMNASMIMSNPVQESVNISNTPNDLNTRVSFPQSPSIFSTKNTEKVAVNANVSLAQPVVGLAAPVPNTDKIFTKLPVVIPVDKVTNMIPPPESLSCSTLPVPPPVQNIRVNMSVTHPQVSLLPPHSLITTQIPVPPVVVPVAPMAPIVPVAPIFNAEPLNLSSSKAIKKSNVTHDLSYPNSFRNSTPARRQTICGFEARNMFVDDEPLDLSQKSKKAQVEATDTHSLMPFLKPIVPPAKTTMPPPLNINLNKQFYSNLELLRIPQVRNPIKKNIEPVNLIPKSIIKKRNSNKNIVEKNAQSITTAIGGKIHNKDCSSQKKDNINKFKNAQKMDDEVINHIDDAINSVINAVKASLPSDECEEQKSIENVKTLEHSIPILPIEKPHKPQESNEETTKDAMPIVQTSVKSLPQKRCVRSKTLDCRPMALKAFSNILQEHHEPTPHIFENSVNTENRIAATATEEVAPVQNINIVKSVCENSIKSLQVNGNEEDTDKASLKSLKQPLNLNDNNLNSLSANEVKLKENHSSEKENEIQVDKSSSKVSHSIVNEENMSNINNTSSGFHSSGQIETAVEAKKKQRRRRKNELAAIVADQLLESFKIDKTRRDNLKKLENLAYEKSEDLLITGMLLMSSTKRNATNSFKRGIQNTDMFNKNIDDNSSKRQKHNSAKISKNKSEKTTFSSNSETLKPVNEERIPVNNCPIEKETNCKRNRRRTYRSKGTSFDNDNISKLKSSLESFSIGIEKQLSELEARNSNVFTFSEKKTYCASSVSTRSSLLKPSILCTKPERINEEKVQMLEGKMAISSRDPRLNKNIHKNEIQGLGSSKSLANLQDIADAEDDNYLTEIAKNVNDKIMSAENEEFAFGNDSFVMANELQDDSNSKYSRPPTSMSVRSAPNFNDDRSNFGSFCDENTNTDMMDMDLEDELSVYTSYSQDIGRNRGRRRRRRRSILLKRRPKKRINRETCTEKFECTLCKKTFFTLNSLTKHNMTLAHVSNVSAQEYLLSKDLHNVSSQISNNKEAQPIDGLANNTIKGKSIQSHLNSQSVIEFQENIHINANINEKHELGSNDKNTYTNPSRLTLNPDERLFFECCNILKGTETACINNDDCNKNDVYPLYGNKNHQPTNNSNIKAVKNDIHSTKTHIATTNTNLEQNIFRSPSVIHPNNKNFTSVIAPPNQHFSPNYCAASQFSGVTNTTSRFKTKAAMKGYENMNVDLSIYQESTKTRTICKLTELAEIALGNEKTNSPEFIDSTNHNDGTILKPLTDREYVTLSAIDHQKGFNSEIERAKNNETQSSTSSKTIMHSSIIKAAVEEHNKMVCGKIVIPDRPFKNIGLEEKETITFQKPKTTINLLTDDNSVSTTSYSDRDDFDFASISCDEESNGKTNNGHQLENNSESNSSRATAKTFENKSLIMGRIFKNVSTKAKNATILQNVDVQNDPQPKTDMNQLFDELRGDCVGKLNTTETVLKKQFIEISENHQKNQLNVESERSISRLSKELRKKSNSNPKSQKDISRLESELGMSQEEIVKLINEGQRKSKRRCATNQPKKLVEMWSSDEYEEFLSTKDIIALIEEKEKQEGKRKRKNSANQTKISDNKNKLARTHQTITNKNITNSNQIEHKERSLNYSKKHRKNENTNATEISEASETAKVMKNITTIGSAESQGKYTRRSAAKECVIKHKIIANDDMKKNVTNSRYNMKKKTTSKESKAGRSEITEAEQVLKLDNDILKASNVKNCQNFTKDSRTSQDQDEVYLPEIKRNSHRTGRSIEKNYSKCRQIVYNLKNYSKKSGSTNVVNKKQNVSNKNNINRVCKKKLRVPPNKSPPRRKRLATEKLYYWSSSSDEDFGKINSACAQELDGGEQYQKHGWIVGDSHKKLVTLLAIAKGSKKVDNCGVKKKVCKKKN